MCSCWQKHLTGSVMKYPCKIHPGFGTWKKHDTNKIQSLEFRNTHWPKTGQDISRFQCITYLKHSCTSQESKGLWHPASRQPQQESLSLLKFESLKKISTRTFAETLKQTNSSPSAPTSTWSWIGCRWIQNPQKKNDFPNFQWNASFQNQPNGESFFLLGQRYKWLLKCVLPWRQGTKLNNCAALGYFQMPATRECPDSHEKACF